MRLTAPLVLGSFACAVVSGAVWQGALLLHAMGSSPAPRPRMAVIRLLDQAPVAADALGREAPPLAAPAPLPALPPAGPSAALAVPTQMPGDAGAPPAPSRATAPATPDAAPSPVVDETALRYFARQGDTKRLNAEIARLRLLYPTWTPPDDPLKTTAIADPELDRLWQLYAQGQYASVRAAIASRQASEPGWQPPKDLLDRLAVGEARQRLVNASDVKQYATVIRIAADTPSLLTCGDVDVLWRVAEAFGRTDKPSRAQDAYRYVLTNCASPEERLATVQKAAAVLPNDTLQPLLELGRPGPDGGEFRAVREDLARRAVAAAGTDPTLAVAPATLDVLRRLAESGGSAADPMLLGWYELRHNDPAQAEHWFSLSHDREDAALSSQGLALALIALKRPADAEAVLYKWRDTSDETRKTYLAAAANLIGQQPPAAIPNDVLARIVAVVGQTRDAATGQQLGWYSRALGQEETAARWFATVLGWKPDDEPSAFGLALADARLGRRDAVLALIRQWGARSPRILALGERRTPGTTPIAAAAMPTAGSPAPAELAPPAPVASAAPMPAQPEFALPAPVLPAPVLPAAYERTAAATPVPPQTGAPAPPPLPVAPARADLSPARMAGTVRMAPAREVFVSPEPLRPGTTSAAPMSSNCGGSPLTQGWCLMKLGRPSQAAIAFRAAAASGSAKDRQDASYGLSLAFLRLGLTGQAALAAVQARQPTARIGELDTGILAQRIIAAYDAGRYTEALIDLDARARITPELIDLKTLRGWSYYHLTRYQDAFQVFDALSSTGYHDALAGLVASQAALTPTR